MNSPAGTDSALRRRVRQQEAVAELGQRALEIDDLDRLMAEACEALAKTLDAEYATVLELLPDGDAVSLRQGVGWRDELLGEATVSTDRASQAGYTLLSEAPVIVDDLRSEERFSGPDLLTDRGVVSGISVIIGSVEDPWGVLGTHDTERREFTDDDANFVRSVANVLASAIENHRTRRSPCAEESQSPPFVREVEDYAIFVLDRDGRVRSWNRGAERIKGYEEAEIVGEHFSTFYPAPAAESGLPERLLSEAVAEGRTEHEGWRVRKDGSRFWASVSITALTDDDGELRGFTKVTEDLTDRRRREIELERSERRYRTLSECFPNGIVTLFDDELTYTLAAGRAFEELPVSPDEIEGRTPREAWGDDVADVLEPAMRSALDGDEVAVETAYADRNWEIHAVPVADDEGDVFTGMTMAQDVTERNERERKLEQYRALTRAANDGIVTIDESSTIQSVNPAVEEIFGYEPDELVGERLTVLMPADLEGQHLDALGRYLETGERTLDWDYVELPGRHRDGSTVPLAISFSEVEHEDERFFTGVVRDITERRAYERRLEESERRYRTLAENFPNGAVGVYDRDLRYTLAEGAVLDESLPPADRLEGNRMPDVFPDETVADLEPLFRAAVERGEAGDATTTFGGRNWRVWAAPLRDADGDIFGGLSFAQDVTERIERQERLEELVERLEASNERLEQFAYAASHDLQEPLRMVSSYLQLIERRYADELDADGEEFLDYAVDGAERMRAMIDGLLQYSRVDTQGDPLEPVDLGDAFDAALENLRVKIEERDAEISVESLPRVRGDESQLQQVFQNLLSNAIEYAGDEPPRIHVSTERRGRRWEISVSDEGIGIDPDEADRVFEVFQRLHSRDEHAGTGIGLALCERIVERHGGEIRVESESGEGATFSFTLPAVDGRDA